MGLPLVSVPVITYNSADTILKGLESIKIQTYKNIELVISDDCSTDNTVEICRKWLDENKMRFSRTKLVVSPINTGVSGNLNRALAECTGEWIRGLSGDDMFTPETIKSYYDFFKENPDCDICFGKFKFYGNDNELVSKTQRHYEQYYYKYLKADLKTQQKHILKEMFVPGPGICYKRYLWNEVGGYDEKYPFCEEDPFFNRVILNGHRIYFIDKEIYAYKVHANSLSQSSNGLKRHMKDRIQYFKDERRRNLIKRFHFLTALEQTINYSIFQNYSPWKKLLYLFSPLHYKTFFNRHIH